MVSASRVGAARGMLAARGKSVVNDKPVARGMAPLPRTVASFRTPSPPGMCVGPGTFAVSDTTAALDRTASLDFVAESHTIASLGCTAALGTMASADLTAAPGMIAAVECTAVPEIFGASGRIVVRGTAGVRALICGLHKALAADVVG